MATLWCVWLVVITIPKFLYPADDAYHSKKEGRICEHNKPVNTIADGLKTLLGPNTLSVVLQSVDTIVTVSERDIARASK